MASLMEVRDMLALQGRMEAKQLSARLRTPQPLIDAMLERMEAMGKVVRISETSEGCLSGSCKSCPEGKAACHHSFAVMMDGEDTLQCGTEIDTVRLVTIFGHLGKTYH